MSNRFRESCPDGVEYLTLDVVTAYGLEECIAVPYCTFDPDYIEEAGSMQNRAEHSGLATLALIGSIQGAMAGWGSFFYKETPHSRAISTIRERVEQDEIDPSVLKLALDQIRNGEFDDSDLGKAFLTDD